MPHYYTEREINTYIDKRVLKDTLNRFSYMDESKLLTRVNRLTKKEKILATILVAERLDIPIVKRAAVRKLYHLYSDYYVGDGGQSARGVEEKTMEEMRLHYNRTRGSR